MSSPDFSGVVGSFGFILNYCRGWTTLQIRFDPWMSSLRTLLERFHNLVMVEGFDGKFSQCHTDGDCQICQQGSAFLFPISPNSDIVWPVFIGDVASWIGFQMINSVVRFSTELSLFVPQDPFCILLYLALCLQRLTSIALPLSFGCWWSLANERPQYELREKVGGNLWVSLH